MMVAAAAAGAYWLRSGSEPDKVPARAARPPIPVTVAMVSRRDVPVRLSGLGTVQASMATAVHSQVDGKLEAVLFTEGQRVKKGDVLAKIDPRLFQAALDQAVAKKAQDAAQLVAAEKDLVRFKTLALKKFETEQNVDLQIAKVDQLKATIQADQAAIESAQTQLDYTTITVPYDGRIGMRQVDPGNIIHAADVTPLATLTQTEPVAVVFTLPAKSLDDVRKAMSRGPVEVVVFDQDNRLQLATGTLLLVDNVIDPATATIRLKAMFANDDESLWPGAFVNARLLLENRLDTLTIPSAAIQRGPKGLFAWTVGSNDIVEMRPIEVGPTSGDLTIVSSGLNDGDRVVVAGHYKLQTGARVSVTPARSAGSGRSS